MTWRQYESTVEGRRGSVLLDTGFSSRLSPGLLTELGWFGVYSRLDPGGAYWHPNETDDLDAIESDLLRLCEGVGQGNAVYVRRLDTQGIREYYIYFSVGTDLRGVLPRLQLLHPGYRIEYDQQSDPAWDRYKAWLSERRSA